LVSAFGVKILSVCPAIPLRQLVSRLDVLITALTVVVVLLTETALVVVARGAEACDIEEASEVLPVADGWVGARSRVAFAGIVCGRE